MIYFLMSFNASYLSINILILVKNGIFLVISDIYNIFATVNRFDAANGMVKPFNTKNYFLWVVRSSLLKIKE